MISSWHSRVKVIDECFEWVGADVAVFVQCLACDLWLPGVCVCVCVYVCVCLTVRVLLFALYIFLRGQLGEKVK